MVELNKKHESLKRRRKMYSKCVFLFNREVPIYALQYLVMSFGGTFITQDDLDLKPELKYTHHVIDRPLRTKLNNIEYIQPQYIVDSLNNLYLLPTSQYAPGVSLPAHLSPFTDNEKEGYVPNRQKEIAHLKGEEIIESEEEEEEEQPKKPVAKAKAEKTKAKKAEEVVEEEEEADGKGDADSSEDEEASESQEEDVAMTQAERRAANAKLKRDLQKEQTEMAKVLMTKK
jgi:pescadillo protein